MGGETEALAVQFGENLRAQRWTAGLSQEALGELASLHRTAVGLLERGKREPRVSTVVRLADALGIPAAELLRGIE